MLLAKKKREAQKNVKKRVKRKTKAFNFPPRDGLTDILRFSLLFIRPAAISKTSLKIY
jgi:hypothetical protein